MKKILLITFSIICFSNLQAQKTFSTKSAQIKFYSKTPAEDIEAKNNQVVASFVDKTGALNFAILIKGFRFENELMQEHFNKEEYMNSTKFPKATYKGSITNIATINFAKNGSYPATSEGSLTIRGITKKIKTTGTVIIANGKPTIKSVFKIALKDYGITGSEIGGSIAKDIEITLNAVYN